MKLSIQLSSMSLILLMGLVLGILLLADIREHRGAVVTTPQAGTADRVVAKEFVLTDDNGNTRARIGMNETGSPCMQLFDRQGHQRAQLRLNEDDIPSLRLYDDQGALRSVMGFSLKDQQPKFLLFDESGRGTPLKLEDDEMQLDNYLDDDVVRKGQWLYPSLHYQLPPPAYEYDSPYSIHIDGHTEVLRVPQTWATPEPDHSDSSSDGN